MKNWLLAHSGAVGRMGFRLTNDRRAVTSLEYALIAGVVVVTILVGFQTLADDIKLKFSNIGGSLNPAGP